MKRRNLLLFIIPFLFCLLLTGCDFLFSTEDHDCVLTEWEVIDEPTCTRDGEEERYCIICYEFETRKIKGEHTPVQVEENPANCTKEGRTAGSYCEECNVILSGLKVIPATGHTEVIDPAVPSTDTTPGRTEGKHCSTCGEILIRQTTVFIGDYSNPDMYHGDYAYESLAKLSNGSGMRDFYNEIDEVASYFHASLNDAKERESEKGTVYYVAEIEFSDNGINVTEALSAWNAYIKDHPLYYWLSNYITYNDEYIVLTVYEEYVDGEVREQLNLEIYNKVEEIVTSLDGVTDTYSTTLGIHDLLINDADYAYQSDGVTPLNTTEAHNIIGVLLDGSGVCESYSKSFQLLLNYCDIDNVYVTGYAGEAHAWNLVLLDDGRWYWYDLTWNDQPSWMLGVRHNYFCVSNSDYVDYTDGTTAKSLHFLNDHTPTAPGGEGVYFSYELPKASDLPYEYDGLMVRDDIIEKDGLSYVLIGFNTVSLIKIEAEGKIAIPNSINHNGTNLAVACIGNYDAENGIFIAGSIIEYISTTREHVDVTEVSIPDTVKFIWDFAFDHCYTIENFVVSEDNPIFASKDGVLFTKSLYTLIKYPLAKKGASYVIPSATVEIAYGAFGDGGNVFCPEYLSQLTIPSSVEVIGAANGGKGFRNQTPLKPSDIVIIDGYLDKLYVIFGYDGINK